MRRWIPFLLLIGLSHQVFAQRGQLSLGLSTTYYPTGVAGLGGALDYRWRLCGRFEAIGQFNAMHFWRVYPESERHYNTSDDRANLYFAGIGLGYRARPDGFHIGLLGGGMRYLESTGHNDEVEPRIMPGLALTVGHGICRHVDVSLDAWVLKGTEKEETVVALPLLRVSYKLLGGK